MQKLLLQNTTGAVYPWSESLAKRKDMVDYEPEPKAKKEKAAPTDTQVMAKAVLTKKPGRKPNAEEAGESEQTQAAEGTQEQEGSA